MYLPLELHRFYMHKINKIQRLHCQTSYTQLSLWVLMDTYMRWWLQAMVCMVFEYDDVLDASIDVFLCNIVTNITNLNAFNVNTARYLTMTNITTYNTKAVVSTVCLHLEIDGMFSNDVPASWSYVISMTGCNSSSTATFNDIYLKNLDESLNNKGISCTSVSMWRCLLCNNDDELDETVISNFVQTGGTAVISLKIGTSEQTSAASVTVRNVTWHAADHVGASTNIISIVASTYMFDYLIITNRQ